MLIMIIFLVLSVIFLIGTIVYVNIKKKNRNNTKINTNKETKDKTNKKNEKRLSDVFQIKVKNDMICIENRYSKIVGLGNIDYNILSAEEQTTTELKLETVARAINYPIQFYTTTEFIDTNKIIAYMEQNKVKNEKVQEYKYELISFLQRLMDNRVLSIIKNYAIISYDGLYENAVDELNQRVNSFKSSVLDANISCEILNEDEIFDLLYRELNKNSVNKVSNLKKGGKSLYVGKKQENKRNRKRYI